MKDIETLIGNLQEDYDLLTYDKEQESVETAKIANDIAMVIALLKEQEAVEPLFNERMKWFVCPNCSLVLDEMQDDYCPSCGKRIAWNEYYLHEDETESR